MYMAKAQNIESTAELAFGRFEQVLTPGPEVIRSMIEPSFLTSVRSFKSDRTDLIGTEQRSEPTDVESGFLYYRTESI